EGSAVGSSGVAPERGRYLIKTPILEEVHRVLNHLRGLGRAEHARGARLASAAVDVQVAIELEVFGLRILGAAEVLGDVGNGPIEAFLFAAPQCDSNRAPRLRADRLQQPDRFERDGRSCAVVSGAGSAVP